MRVLHVLHSLNQNYGGPLRAVLDLSARAAAQGLDAEVIGLGPIAIPDNPFPVVNIHSMAAGFPSGYGYAPHLRTWLDQNIKRFDGVILHGMWLYPNWATARACQSHKIPYVCFPHGMLEPWAFYGQGYLKALKKTLYWTLVEKKLVCEATAVFFTTERERSLAIKMNLLKGTGFIVIPYGVDGSIHRSAQPDRARIAVAPNRKVALFLGRLHPKKNIELLIEAWSQAKPNGEWLLMIAGPGESQYRRALERLSKKHAVDHQIHFTGPVSGGDKAYLLGRASWFLMPSKQENFGITVLEALAAGCAVAISDQVFLSDYFHPRSEILPTQVDAWVDFLSSRMPDELHRQSLIALDREFVIPRFEINGIVKSWSTAIAAAFRKK